MRPRQQDSERTCFQEAGDFKPRTDSKADVAIVYGLNPTFEDRVEHWRQAGYRIHVMTGVAWGDYADYVRGQWDGTPHFDDAQTEIGNFRLEHGISQGHDIYYMIPSLPYTRYLSEKLRRVVDSGAAAIHLEEPEFWVRAGYGEGFEREWKLFYGEPWQDPLSSPDARYRASKLMQRLYTRALTQLFADLKEYAREKGNLDFKCYVPTHSLINYAHWRIVSPESRLLSILDCDGIIGQVWTGTSRTPNIYKGVFRQRTFEAGYCEYASCAAMVRGTGKKLWQLADPIEDNPKYCWDDYRYNWECTVVGSLLVPESDRFEIMPWPSRIFLREYPTENLDTLPLAPLLERYLTRLEAEGQHELAEETRRAVELFLAFRLEKGDEIKRETLGFANLAEPSADMRFGDVWSGVYSFYKLISGWPDQDAAQRVRHALSALYHNAAGDRAGIPAAYATELQIVFNALADMHWPGEVVWLSGFTGVSMAISDTLMFQRGDPDGSDGDMSSLYGLAMPLVKHGVALSFAQMERMKEAGYLDAEKILFLTYEGQKPPSPDSHAAIIEWVKRGNVLLLFGSGDAYNQVREWWNQGDMHYDRPQDHLLELAGIDKNQQEGVFSCGSGYVMLYSDSPCELAYDSAGPEKVINALKAAASKLSLPFEPSHVLALRHGPYVAAGGMDEGEEQAGDPFVLKGQWVNLFDAELPVIQDPVIAPGTRWLLYDLSKLPGTPWVIASAGRVQEEQFTESSLSFVVEGMENTQGIARIFTPQPSRAVEVDGASAGFQWDESTRTTTIRFANAVNGVAVKVQW